VLSEFGRAVTIVCSGYLFWAKKVGWKTLFLRYFNMLAPMNEWRSVIC